MLIEIKLSNTFFEEMGSLSSVIEGENKGPPVKAEEVCIRAYSFAKKLRAGWTALESCDSGLEHRFPNI